MNAQRTLFRLYSHEGVCLYVGRTSKLPHEVVKLVRVYRLKRPWGDQIDLDGTVSVAYPNEAAAIRAQPNWLADYAPVHASTPTTRRRRRPTVEADLPLVERVRRQQKRHRTFSGR